jgi:hypothetical protein
MRRISHGACMACRVHWYNEVTGGLEQCISKSLKMGMAASHPAGWVGLEAEARAEVDAMLYLAGVRGVVRCRDLIVVKDEAIQIIME